MTTTPTAPDTEIPTAIAEQIMLPEGHRDNDALFEAYAWLREHNPLGQAHLDGYDPVYLVSKHRDIMEVERRADVFSSCGGKDNPGAYNPILGNQAGDEFTKSINNGSLRIVESVTYMDPPEHKEIRGIVNDSFKPANLRKWDAPIREIAKAAVDKLLAGDTEIDFVKDFARYFPLRVIMSLFGVPEEDEPRMMLLTQELFGTTDPDAIRDDVEPLTPLAAAQQWAATVRDFYAYFDVMLQDRRANPTGDLASIIAQARDGSGEYYPKEIAYGHFIIIATAGHDTTSATIAGGMHALAQDPELLRRIQNDLSLIPRLIDESLRWASPAKHFMRAATEEFELRGRTVVPGDRLMLLYQSGNRDEEVFDHPEVFDIDRHPNRHISFGYGPHMCLGQQLAKIELAALFEALLPHLESIELNGDSDYVATHFVGGLKSMPVTMRFRA